MNKKKLEPWRKRKLKGNNSVIMYIIGIYVLRFFVVYKKINQEREKALGCSPLYERSESLLECKL